MAGANPRIILILNRNTNDFHKKPLKGVGVFILFVILNSDNCSNRVSSKREQGAYSRKQRFPNTEMSKT